MKSSCALAGLLVVCTGCVLLEREIGNLGVSEVARPSGARPGDPAPPSAPKPPLEPPPAQRSCCSFRVGPLIEIDSNSPRHRGPSIAWAGTAWAVAWPHTFQDFYATPPSSPYGQQAAVGLVGTDAPGTFLRLEEDMDPIGIGYDSDIAPGGGYLVALRTDYYAGSGDSSGRVVAIDTSGGRLGSFELGYMRTAELAEVTGLGAWAVLSSRWTGEEPSRQQLILLDRAMVPLGPPVDIGTAPFSDPRGAKVLALNGQVITVLLSTTNKIEIRTFVGRTLAEPQPAVILDEGMIEDLILTPLGPRAALSAALVGDVVVIAARDRNSTRTWSYRPATRTVIDGPNVVGPGAPGTSVHIAGDSQGTSAGLCLSVGREVGPDGPVELMFALVGPDGRPLGQPVTIASDMQYHVYCDVAAGRAGEYLVAFWHFSRSVDRRKNLLAARVEVQGLKPTLE